MEGGLKKPSSYFFKDFKDLKDFRDLKDFKDLNPKNQTIMKKKTITNPYTALPIHLDNGTRQQNN